ncbi:AAA family ATPase [Roseomonas mucosa]
MEGGPKPVLEIILEWSEDRPLWQRSALQRVVSKGKLDDNDIIELADLCRREKIKDLTIEECKILKKEDLPANPGAGQDITVDSISAVLGVNQLAPGQEIVFGSSGMTIVYGENGTGKSGYTRIFKRSCQARHTGKIISNVFDSGATSQAKATISYRCASATMPPISWIDENKPHPVLSAINVFDRECGAIHVREKTEVVFRPFGLDIPDDLADACQRVKNYLNAEVEKLKKTRDGLFEKPTWKPSTRVGAVLSNLKASSDLGELSKLSEILAEDRDRHRRLCEDLARDAHKAAAEQELYANQISSLVKELEKIRDENSDDVLNDLKLKANDANHKRQAAKVAAEHAFGSAPIKGVGEPIWRELWEAARHYSDHIACLDQTFPPKEEGAICVLCQQPLNGNAVLRFKSFDNFIKEDVEKHAQTAEQDYRAAKARFEGLSIRPDSFSTMRQRIALEDKSLSRSIFRYLALVRLRRNVCRKFLEQDGKLELRSASDGPFLALRELEGKKRKYAEELHHAANDEGRKCLEDERDDLADRIALEVLHSKASAEVERLRAIKLASECAAEINTNAITRLGNHIADEVITPKMRDQFQNEIVQLAASRVRVELIRAGGKYGSPYYQVRLFANPKATVHDVLSEGEQTCVAMAAFLTELANSAHRSALVFDDPVTSLDHRWRLKVAERLVAEAKVRQIIVFTHDIVFLNDLKDGAEKEKVPVKLVSLTRTPLGAGVVADGLPWIAATVRSRVDALEKEARAAKLLFDSDDESGYREAAFRIYNKLRNTWERAIEDVAFSGVINRHRDYINTKNLRKVTALESDDCDAFSVGFEKCCDQTDAHDLSRGRSAAPPPPDEILRDVQAVFAWVNSLRERQKHIS